MISSTPWMASDVQSHLEAMADACKLRFSAYDAPIWMLFLPTASQRQDTTILLIFAGGDGRQWAGDGGAFQVKLGVGVGSLRYFTSDGKGIYRGGDSWIRSLDGRLDLGRGVSARQRELGLGL
jgi:hypothetical protein